MFILAKSQSNQKRRLISVSQISLTSKESHLHVSRYGRKRREAGEEWPEEMVAMDEKVGSHQQPLSHFLPEKSRKCKGEKTNW